MKKALITGCAGFIGSHAAVAFAKCGYTVVGVDNLSRLGARENLKVLRDLGCRFVFCECDIRSLSSVQDVFSKHGPFDCVLHLAAQVAVTTSIENPQLDFEVNTCGTFNVLEAARHKSPEAVFGYASTNKVYGSLPHRQVENNGNQYRYLGKETAISECEPLDFHSPYGCSKGAADQYVRDYGRVYGMRTIVFRQSCIYGTRQYGMEDQGWIAWFVIAAIVGKPITVFGDGYQSRDVLWVSDLIELYLQSFEVVDRQSGVGLVYNVGGGIRNVLSIRELLQMLRILGVLRLEPKYCDWRAGDQKTFVADIARACSDFEWKPSVTPEMGVHRIAKWVQSEKKQIRSILGM